MKSKEEFRERFSNGEFNEELKNISSAEELVEFARTLGYKITVEDILNTKLNKEEMAMIAGGKGESSTTNNDNSVNVTGDGNLVMNIS